MTAIRVELANLAPVQQAIRLLGGIGQDLTPLMRQAAGILEGAAEDAFAKERSPDGHQWEKLALSTQAKLVTRGRLNKKTGKRSGGKRRGSKSILRVTGRLAASVQTHVEKKAVSIGSNVIYAALQQFGQRPGKMPPVPARPYIGLGTEHIAEIQDAAAEHIHRQVRAWLPRT